MRQTITESQFVNRVVSDEYNNMSYEGARALFEYIEEFEDSCGTEIEFDVVALRCEWTEYENIQEALNEYNELRTASDLRDNTTVIEIPESDKVIIQEF